MRFLLISTAFPRELHLNTSGIFKRLRMFIDAMKEIAQLDILFYVDPKLDISPWAVEKQQNLISKYWDINFRLFLCPLFRERSKLTNWQLYGRGSLSFFKQISHICTSNRQQVQAFEACLSYKPDAIFAHRLPTMCPILLSKRPRRDLPPVFFDLDDIEHITFWRTIHQPPKWRSKFLYYFSLPALFWGEHRAINLARKTFICSEDDRLHLQKIFRHSCITTIPNAVHIPPLQALPETPTLLFLGSYDYLPNVVAAEFLIKHIWPRIYKQMPSARLLIAGKDQDKICSYHTPTSLPGVTFTGFVDDLGHLYQQSRIVCCPILSGGGTRLKIIEAAAFARPVVSTTIGAEGLQMRDGEDILLRDDPQSFADACLMLLNDMERCKNLALAGHKKALESYDRNNIVNLIQKTLLTG